MQSQDHSGLPSSYKRWKTGVGQSQLVYTCLNALWAQVWASSQRRLTCLWSAGLYLWEAAFQVRRGKEKTFLCHLSPSTSAAGAAHHWALAGEVGVRGGKTAGTSSWPHLEPPNLLIAYCVVKQTAFTSCCVCGIGCFMILPSGNLSANW